MLLLNAFSLNMFDPSSSFPIFREMQVDEVKKISLESAIGHADTAKVLSSILEMDIPTNRVTVQLKQNEKCIVAQYIGPRLPEGSLRLPEGSKIEFFLVKMKSRKSFEKMISLQKDISKLAHDIGGWGDLISIDDVKKVLKNNFPHYFCEHAFD